MSIAALPLALDPHEQQRLLLAVTVLAAFTNETAAPVTPVRSVPTTKAGRARPARGRKHVRPARSC